MTESVDEHGLGKGRFGKRLVREIILWAIVLASGSLVLGVILVVVVYVSAVDATKEFEAQNITTLMLVTSFDEAQANIGRLGVVLGTPEGSWVAIEYRDKHSAVVASSAVAKTSDGRWYKSARHYCGRFAGYTSMRKYNSDDEVVERFPRLADADSADSIDEMIEILLEFGFVEFEP